MSKLQDFGAEIEVSVVPGAGTLPSTTQLDGEHIVSEGGRVHFQIDHSFENSNVLVYPRVSVDGVTYTPIYKSGVRLEVALSESPTAFILTDLVPGSIVKLGVDFADQETGMLMIKTAG